MNLKSLSTLEFYKILQLLEEKAISPMGKALCRELLPCADLADVEKAQEETAQALGFLLKMGSLPLGGIRDIRPAVQRAEMAGMLLIEELFGIGEFIYVCGKAARYAAADAKREHYSIIDPQFEDIRTMAGLAAELSRCIQNEREIADDASPRLADIRRQIKITGARINEALNAIIHSAAYKNMLQEAVITIRASRYCVPIKQEYRNSFPGMIHDSSSSGATVFMEPMSVVNLNNKIKELEADEREEIEKILRKLSAMVAEHGADLADNLEILTYLDFVFAKGELALEQNANRPIFNDSGQINIEKGRHPLLNTDNVVPIDIHLGDNFTTLLITGPNTGGKTVALKTLGLFTLMGQAGLHIPAREKSRLAVFDNVFADIGDEQSIEQSLSTFSSHMVNIVKILDEVNYNSLVLFDELGAGTDPTEGAALAISIIRYLLERGVRSAITTHYSELKVFALSTEGVENAACEFDVATLRPTYRLLIGVPGKSNAFAISARLGLNPAIIDAAREFLSSESIRFEDLLTDLEISRKSVEMEQERAADFRKQAERLAADFENQKSRLAESREKVMNQARADARTIVEAAKAESDKIIRDMARTAADRGGMRDLEDGRQKLRDKINELGEISTPKPKQTLAPIDRPLKAGDRVFIHSLNQKAVIAKILPNNTEAMAKMGAMEIKVKIADLSLDADKEPDAPKSGSASKNTALTSGKAMGISPKIDLRGMLADQAIDELSKYLDDAYLSNIGKIEIIHGKGTGALRAAVTNHLKKHPHIKSHRLGTFGEGEDGVTIAEIK